MSLVWHMVGSDLRRLRGSLGLWVAIIAAKLGLGVLLLSGNVVDLRLFHALTRVGNGIIALEVLAGYFLVAALVQKDVLVGTTAFWMTRPISGGRLLSAKLLGLVAIFGVMPFFVTLPWWLGCGYGVREIAWASAETWFWHALVVALALPLATLTNGFSRFLLWSLVLVVAIAIMNLMMILAPEMERRTAADVTVLMLAAREALGVLIFMAGGGVAAVEQFRRRRIARSLGILGVTIAVALVPLSSETVGLWLRPWLDRALHVKESAGTPARYAGDSSAIHLSFLRAEAKEIPAHKVQIRVHLKIEGLSPGYFLRGMGAQHVWTWPSGQEFKAREDYFRQPWNEASAWHALGIPAVDLPSNSLSVINAPENSGAISYATVPTQFVTRTRRDPPAYSLRANFQLSRAIVAGERPLRVGETFAFSRVITRIAFVRASFWSKGPRLNSAISPGNTHYLQVVLVEHRPVLLGEGEFGGVGTISSDWDSSSFFLINRTRGNAIRSDRNYPLVTARFATVGIAWQMLGSGSRTGMPGGDLIQEPGWLEGPLTLAKVITENEGQFTTEMPVARFELSAEPISEEEK